MAVKGICKARAEAHIIQDTLDHWAPLCDAGIHVYVDAGPLPPHGLDATAEVCRAHAAVVEVIVSTLLDPDRERAEWYNRQLLLNSARRFLGPRDWIAYFDADEHPYDLDLELLKRPLLRRICTPMFESYITAEDEHLSEWQYAQRRWCGDEWEYSPMLFRNAAVVGYTRPDQRNMDIGPVAPVEDCTTGICRHWGKGLSVKRWEQKCEYYATTFGPRYAAKWDRRRGRAVHTLSDFGRPLVLWDDLRARRVPTHWRREMELVS